jgi:hypothetical protein
MMQQEQLIQATQPHGVVRKSKQDRVGTKPWGGFTALLGDCTAADTASFFGAIVQGAIADLQQSDPELILRGVRYLFLEENSTQSAENPRTFGALCQKFGISSDYVAKLIWRRALTDTQRNRITAVLRNNGFSVR